MTDTMTERLQELHALFGRDSSALIAAAEKMLAEDPGFSPALMMMGLVALAGDNEGLAINFLEQAHGMDPERREYVDMLSTILPRVGRVSESLYYAKLAITLDTDPELAAFVPRELISYKKALDQVQLSSHGVKADIALRQGHFDDAVKQGGEELRVDPANVDAMVIVARALTGLGRGWAALNMFRAAVLLQPNSGWIHVWMADALLACGQHTEAAQHLRLGLELCPDDRALAAHVAGLTHWLDDGDWLLTADLRDQIALLMKSGRGVRTPDMPTTTAMLGLLTDQTHRSALSDFVLPVLKEYESIVLYRLGQRSDSDTDAYRHSVLRVRECADMDMFTMGRTMMGDLLTAIVHVGLPSLESKYVNFAGVGGPASVQWLSQPLGDRLPTAEIVVGDGETADIDDREFGPEAVVRLDHLVAYKFPEVAAPDENVSDCPREVTGKVTFGVWSDLRRFTPSAISLWARCLLAVPGAGLLVAGHDPWEKEALQWLYERFSEFGVGERVRVHFKADPLASRLSFLGEVDVMLDTAPVSGSEEVAAPLWMGVPVVTLKGRRRAGRLGASILNAAGRSQWIAQTAEEFVEKAKQVALAPDLPAIRQGLRAEVLASPLTQINSYAGSLTQKIIAKVMAGVPGRG